MNFQKNILIINSSFFISGAEISLFQYLSELKKQHKYNNKILIVLPKTFQYVQLLPANCELIYLPLIWFKHSISPIYLIKCLINVIFCSLKLKQVVHNKSIDIVYSNSIKSQIYGAALKVLTNKKIVWHARDNLKNDLLTRLLIKKSDKIICISKHIYSQLKAPLNKKVLIYGGIDIDKWYPYNESSELKKVLGLSQGTKLVAQIGQITSWKNHFDFIKVAKEIIQVSPENISFLIVGDDLSGKEKKYKKAIEREIAKSGLDKYFFSLGFINEIKDLYAQIDILVHPAIDEPFGRVVIEAMAMEIPVVAYICGGPEEIISNNETGYLVKPYDYKAMAEKVITLLTDNELQIKIGKAGRFRVIDQFSMKDYVYNMKTLFERV